MKVEPKMSLEIAFYFLYYLWKLRKAQRLTSSELEELQNRKLRAIVKHAYETVPYYYNLFNAISLKPTDIKTKEDLVKIPITYKKTLQKLPISERVAKGVDISKCIKCRTSGSTGEPLDVLLSKRELSYRIAMQTRIYGLNLMDKKVNILGREPLPPEGSPVTIFGRLKKYLNRLRLWRRYYFSLLDEPGEIVSKLLEIKPNVIETQPSTLRLLCKFVREKNITGISPRSIFTRAELLSREDRNQIETVFGVKLTDLYGIIEFGIVAWECEKHQGYHINSDVVLVEAVKDNQQVYEEEGETVCTDLINYTMPFIRYGIKDVVILSKEKHNCGRNLPLIKLIEGRSTDFITLASGRILSPLVLTSTFQKIGEISQYKLVQENINAFDVQIVKGQNFKGSTTEEVENELREILGSEARINVNIVSEIPREKSGKVRPIESKVAVNL